MAMHMQDPNGFNQFTDPRFWIIMLGAVICLAGGVIAHRRPGIARTLSFVGVFMILLGAVGITIINLI